METTATSSDTNPFRDFRGPQEMILSSRNQEILEIFLIFCLSGPVCLFGIIVNTINIIVFLKQGLDTTVNISLFALAISDLLGLITLEWTYICQCPLFYKADISFHPPDIQILTGGWPHVCFAHITCWITAYITGERCLCIALPLKIKQIITPTRTTLLLSFLFVINLSSSFSEYASIYFDWRFVPERNRSLIGLAFRSNRKEMEGISYIFLAVLSLGAFPVVVLFTIILVIKLRRQSKWRKKSTRETSQSEGPVKRDIKTMNMIVLIAVILIVCNIPGVMGSLTSFFAPGFSYHGVDANLFIVIWEFVVFFDAINSSVNIFLYYKMSTNFRKTFNHMFGINCTIDQ